MARVTVEDCLENVDNRFDLVIQASKRARQLSIEPKKEASLPWDNDKETVMALREIAEKSIDLEELANAPEPVTPRKQTPKMQEPLFSLDEE